MTVVPGLAYIGRDTPDVFVDPVPDLLREIPGLKPEADGLHVLIDAAGVQTTQRLTMSEHRGGLVAGMWPGELKTQAEHLYGLGYATGMIAKALEFGWTVAASPHLAFRNSAPSQRLYMLPEIDPIDYARRWQTGDLRRVGQYSADQVRSVIWPWLKSRGYATAADDPVLEEFLTGKLGKRPAFLRPGLRMMRIWDAEAVRAAGGRSGLATEIRGEVNAILAAAGDRRLPTSAD